MITPGDKTPLFDWDVIQQLIIDAFRGFGSLLEYWNMSPEDKDRHRRVQGWVLNEAKAPRSEDERYYWELPEDKGKEERAADQQLAQGVVDEFDDLLNRYAAEKESFKVPKKFTADWFTALEEANTFFTDKNTALDKEYKQAVEQYKAEQEKEQKKQAALEREIKQTAPDVYKSKVTTDGQYRTGTYFKAPAKEPVKPEKKCGWFARLFNKCDDEKTEAPKNTKPLAEHPFLKKIRELESSNNYNAVFKWTGKAVNFTGMSIKEVLAWQRHKDHIFGYDEDGNPIHRAVGAYQFKPGTLELAVNLAEGISLDTQFTEDTQHRLAYALAVMRGYDQWVNGAITTKQLMEGINKKNPGLAYEWAALPLDSRGKSAYEKEGSSNKALITWDGWMDVLDECKDFEIAPNNDNGYALGFPVFDEKADSPFGMRKLSRLKYARPHLGTDFFVEKNTKVMAIADGEIAHMDTQIKKNGYGMGKFQIIAHKNEHDVTIGFTNNCHLNKYKSGLKTGDQVKRGDVVAYTGDTGAPDNFHLHFETALLIRDENNKVQICMVSYEDMMAYHNQLHDPDVVRHIIDRAVIRNKGTVYTKKNKDGSDQMKDGKPVTVNPVLCQWRWRVEDYLPTGDQINALPAYDFSTADKRLAAEIKKSKGYETTDFPACGHGCDHHDREEDVAEKKADYQNNFPPTSLPTETYGMGVLNMRNGPKY
jgi:murein DD-endopeptidase MepM/ murein hydrolase activator NlpD